MAWPAAGAGSKLGFFSPGGCKPVRREELGQREAKRFFGGQASKSIRWMPWHQEGDEGRGKTAKSDGEPYTGVDPSILRIGGNRHRVMSMWLLAEFHRPGSRRTRGTETSQYPQGKGNQNRDSASSGEANAEEPQTVRIASLPALCTYWVVGPSSCLGREAATDTMRLVERPGEGPAKEGDSPVDENLVDCGWQPEYKRGHV